jgi:hypothetical protein
LKQGQKGLANLTLWNKGNVDDKFSLELSSLKLKSYLKLNRSSPISVASQKSTGIQLEISIPPAAELGWYPITVTAKSAGDTSEIDTTKIWVNVISRFVEVDYNVTIEVIPLTIDIEQSKSGSVSLLIKNTGNQVDNFNVVYQSQYFVGNSVEIKINDSFELEPGNQITVDVVITVPATMDIGVYTVFFEIEGDGKSFDKSEELIVNVLEGIITDVRDRNGDGDTTDPEDDNDGDGIINSADPDDDNDGIPDDQDETPFGAAAGDDDDTDDNSIMIILIVLVVVIIIVILVVMMYLRKKKEEEYLKELEEEEAAEARVDVVDDQQPPMQPSADTGELPMAQPMPVESPDAVPPPESPSVRVEETPVPQPEQPTDDYYPQQPAEGYYQEPTPGIEPASAVEPEYAPPVEPAPSAEPVEVTMNEIEATSPEDAVEGVVCPVCSASIAPGQPQCTICGGSLTG